MFNRSSDSLPVDILNDLKKKFLDIKSVARMSRVSKQWYTLFTDPNFWMNQLIKDFDIKPTVLSLLPPPKDANKFYKNIYARLYCLRQVTSKLPSHLQYICIDPDKQFLLLTCCLDNPDFAFNNIPCEEHHNLLLISIGAGCSNIPIRFLQDEKVDNPLSYASLSYTILSYAISVGNFDVAHFLLKDKNESDLCPTQCMLNTATRQGNFKLLKYLLDPKNHFNLKPNQDTLNNAAYSGNLKMFRYLLLPENQFGLKPNLLTLNNAASSHNLELVCHHLNPENSYRLSPNETTLNNAAKSGCLEIVCYLLNKVKLSPDLKTLYAALESSNLELVCFLLDPNNKFSLRPDDSKALKLWIMWLVSALRCTAKTGNLKVFHLLLSLEKQLQPDIVTLDSAARFGKIELVQYLLNPNNQYNLHPTFNTLMCAVESGSFELVQYLMDAKNQFGLTPNVVILNAALDTCNHKLVPLLLSKELKPTHSTLIQAIQSGNLETLRFLLDPNNQFNLHPNHGTLRFKTPNDGLLKHLLPCDFEIQIAIVLLMRGEYFSAASSFKKSYEYSPTHYSKMLNHILSNSESYGINDEKLQFLLDIDNEVKLTPAKQDNFYMQLK